MDDLQNDIELLEKIEIEREENLVRPPIYPIKIIVFIISHFMLAFLLSVLYLNVVAVQNIVFVEQIKVFFIILGILSVLTSRFVLIWFVKLYQRYAKAETRLRCHMEPTCSQYAILALKKYGTIIGGIKSVIRLFRCKGVKKIDYP